MRGGYSKTRRLKLPADRLQRRATKPYRDLVGAVLRPRVARLIDVTHVAPSHTDEVLIGPVIRHRRDHYSIAVDVDISRIRPAPGEIHRVPVLHPTP
jgi:hypothetical protein